MVKLYLTDSLSDMKKENKKKNLISMLNIRCINGP